MLRKQDPPRERAMKIRAAVHDRMQTAAPDAQSRPLSVASAQLGEAGVVLQRAPRVRDLAHGDALALVFPRSAAEQRPLANG